MIIIFCARASLRTTINTFRIVYFLYNLMNSVRTPLCQLAETLRLRSAPRFALRPL